jgi:hypothetical protein
MLLLVTLVVAYAIEHPLFDEGATIEDHTHAFDEFTAPSLSGNPADLPAFVFGKLNDELDAWELFSLASIGGLLLLGTLFRLLAPRWSVDAWLERVPPPPPDMRQPFWNQPLSGAFLTGVALVGLVIISVYCCYIYYPGPDEAIEMTRSIRVNALVAIKNGQRDQARRGIRLWDDMIRKTEVGLYLRYGWVASDVQREGVQLREILEEAYDSFDEGTWTEERGQEWFIEAGKGSERFRQAVLRQVRPANVGAINR